MAIHGVVGPQMPKNARVRALTGEPLLNRLIVCDQCRCTARIGSGQERDRAWEGQQGLGLHALACFLAATALNPWRFDAISTPGYFASAWIAIRYCRLRLEAGAIVVSMRFVSTWMLPLPSSSSAWDPYSPSLCICLAFRMIGPRPNSLLARAPCFLSLPFARAPCFHCSPFTRASCLLDFLSPSPRSPDSCLFASCLRSQSSFA